MAEQQPLASRIQYTTIGPDVTREDIVTHLETCVRYQFNAAMIAMCWVPLARDFLTGTGVRVATFIDFGMGNTSIKGKAALIRECVRLGADEVDYAPNMGYLLSGMTEAFTREAETLVAAAEGIPLKAMLQLGMLPTEADKRRAVRLLEEAGVEWVKNSSGGWPPGATDATVEDIRLIKASLTGRSRVKASGGIHTAEMAAALLEAGADLLGTSHGPEIIDGVEAKTVTY
jgi:deoxyribose-phosphate aldolase